MPPRNPLDWIALNLLPGLGPIAIARALERFGEPGEIAYRLPVKLLASLRGVSRKAAASIPEARRTLRQRAEEELRKAESLGLRLLVRADEDYPAALAELPDPPPLLYVRGTFPSGVARIAIVGSRRNTLYGERVAAGLAAGLAERKIEVISGSGARR